MDYIVHKKYTVSSPTGTVKNGNNIGFRKENGIYVPLTILVSKQLDLEEYISDDFQTEDIKWISQKTECDCYFADYIIEWKLIVF